ncbi:hypothetical protein [Pedobacter sp. Hv1]|uniref:hypothetical protein n=1 Tax=Pedobacter sp. Hv1 TaxID=1740090 RepID=UPI0006D8C662|nr:hypothetical protein [Pedobacter sp. Hv1]KQC00713.1 hypothetical protein AQF98_08520 [Pedobacter sp. Hv1]
MQQKFEKRFVLIPMGLFLISGTFIVAQFQAMPDLVRGLLFGTGFGLMLLPFLYKKIKPSSY